MPITVKKGAEQALTPSAESRTEGFSPLGVQHTDAPTLPLVDEVGDYIEAGFGDVNASWPVAGSMIDGTYQVIGTLGSGSMGMVLLAKDLRLERQVAIKLIHPGRFHLGFRERFTQEARAMARVNHRNVVQIYAFGDHEGVPYFAMEFVRGNTLDRWRVEQNTPVTLESAIPILDQICQGVAAIHEAGTLHRDIKPSNILLDSESNAHVADLGLALAYSDVQAPSGEVVGTPAYMAPEITYPQPDPPGPQSDIYSLACVAYELFTGKLPYEAEGFAMFVKHATHPIPSVRDTRPDLPPALDAVLTRAMAKDPAERTPSAEAFRRELWEVVRGREMPARILLAEDDEDLRELLGEALREAFPGTEVECVGDGHAALAALEREPASTAIVDLNLPLLDGVSLTSRIRSRVSAAEMPIIVITGSGGAEEWRRLSSIGADRFLVKPVEVDDLTTMIRRVLRNRSEAPPAPGATPT